MNDIASQNILDIKDSVGSKRGHPDDIDNMDALKKPKPDTSIPSKVIHIRQLPFEVTENEIRSLGVPFGKVTNCLLMKAKKSSISRTAGYRLCKNYD